MIFYIGIFILLGFILLGIGYLMGKTTYPPQKSLLDEEWNKVINREKTKQDNIKLPEMPLGDEDTINHNGVGIVMRPTVEELERFNEPQKVKESKQAVAETLAQEVPPALYELCTRKSSITL